MYDNSKRTTKDIINEKYEDRGWGEYNTGLDSLSFNDEEDCILPLALSPEEYEEFALLLGKMCIEDKNPQLCDLYFELKERARKGNHYKIKDFWEMEETIYDIGTNSSLRKESEEKPIRRY